MPRRRTEQEPYGSLRPSGASPGYSSHSRPPSAPMRGRGLMSMAADRAAAGGTSPAEGNPRIPLTALGDQPRSLLGKVANQAAGRQQPGPPRGGFTGLPPKMGEQEGYDYQAAEKGGFPEESFGSQWELPSAPPGTSFSAPSGPGTGGPGAPAGVGAGAPTLPLGAGQPQEGEPGGPGVRPPGMIAPGGGDDGGAQNLEDMVVQQAMAALQGEGVGIPQEGVDAMKEEIWKNVVSQQGKQAEKMAAMGLGASGIAGTGFGNIASAGIGQIRQLQMDAELTKLEDQNNKMQILLANYGHTMDRQTKQQISEKIIANQEAQTAIMQQKADEGTAYTEIMMKMGTSGAEHMTASDQAAAIADWDAIQGMEEGPEKDAAMAAWHANFQGMGTTMTYKGGSGGETGGNSLGGSAPAGGGDGEEGAEGEEGEEGAEGSGPMAGWTTPEGVSTTDWWNLKGKIMEKKIKLMRL